MLVVPMFLYAQFPGLYQYVLVRFYCGIVDHHIQMDHRRDGSAISACISAQGNVDIAQPFLFFLELSILKTVRVQSDPDLCEVVRILYLLNNISELSRTSFIPFNLNDSSLLHL